MTREAMDILFKEMGWEAVNSQSFPEYVYRKVYMTATENKTASCYLFPKSRVLTFTYFSEGRNILEPCILVSYDKPKQLMETLTHVESTVNRSYARKLWLQGIPA